MTVTMRFPAMLQAKTGRVLVIDEPMPDVAALFAWLDRQFPELSAELADPIFNVAVNDEMLLHAVRTHPLRDGDVVELVPSLAGG